MNLILGLIALALCGCASQTQWYQRQTAGHVGCAPSEIKISNADEYAWTATCHDHRYQCAKATNSAAEQMLTGNEGSGQVNCSPAE